MTIRNQVAKLELLAVRRSGRRSVVAISIGRPYEIHDGRGANRAACSISVRGLGPHRYNPRRILGEDTFQALSITLAFVRLRVLETCLPQGFGADCIGEVLAPVPRLNRRRGSPLGRHEFHTAARSRSQPPSVYRTVELPAALVLRLGYESSCEPKRPRTAQLGQCSRPTAPSPVLICDPGLKLARQSCQFGEDEQRRMNLFRSHRFNADRVAGLVSRGTNLVGERRPIRFKALEERGRHTSLPTDNGGLKRREESLDPPVAET